MTASKIIITLLVLFAERTLLAQVPQLKEVLSSSTAHFANNLEFSKDGNHMVSVVGFNADVYQKNGDSFGFLQTINGGRYQAYNTGISEDGSFIAFSNNDETFIYKKEGGSYAKLQVLTHTGKFGIHDIVMRFSGNDKLRIVGGEGNIRFYQFKNDKFVEVSRTIYEDGLLFKEAALSPNGKHLTTLDENGVIRCWGVSDNAAVAGLPLLRTNKYMGILDISDDGLLVAGEEDSLNVYQVAENNNSMTKLVEFPAGKFGEVAFNTAGNRVMFADKSSQLHTYKFVDNMLSLESVNKMPRENFTSIAPSSDDKWIAAASSGAKTIKIFEAPEKLVTIKKTAIKQKTAPGTKSTKSPVVNKPVTTNKSGVAKTPGRAIVPTGTAIPFRKPNGKYHIVDSITARPVYETEYDEVSRLNNGMLGIFLKGHYGIAKKNGEFLINPDTSKFRFIQSEPDSAGNYSGWYYDATRKEMIGEMVLFNKQYKQLTTGHVFIINFGALEKGFYRSTNQSRDLEKSLWGLIDRNGKEILKLEYSYLEVSPENRLILAQRKTNGQELEGLYDYNGKVILPVEYQRVEGWKSPINQKHIIVEKDNLTGIVDKSGKVIVPLKYTSISYSDYGINSYYEIKSNGKTGVMNLQGKELIAPEYKFLYPEFEEGCNFYYASKDGVREGWVDRTGKVILPLIYTGGLSCPGKEGISRARLDDTAFVYVNKNGQNLFGKKFDDGGHFRAGFSYVKEKGKYGMINTKGTYVVQPVYDSLYDLCSEMNQLQMYAAKKDGKWGFLNYAGKLVVPPQYDTPDDEDYGYSIVEDMIAVMLDKKWGYIDRGGKLIIPLQYSEASDFEDGQAIVVLDGKALKIDKKGKEIKE